MKNASFKKALVALSILATAGHVSIALAHSGGGTIDPGSNNASATDLAAVTCFDDGNGTPHHLAGQIKDMSGPGPLLSFHIYKGLQMTTTTDTVPGDSRYSPLVNLNGGAGKYYISATKTKAGARTFDAIWHCETRGGVHTGTEIEIYQIQ